MNALRILSFVVLFTLLIVGGVFLFFKGEEPNEHALLDARFLTIAAYLKTGMVGTLDPAQLIDPWGQTIRQESSDYGYRLVSSGPDKVFGTEDDQDFEVP